MKVILLILIFVPFLVIGCAQPEPPTVPDTSPP